MIWANKTVLTSRLMAARTEMRKMIRSLSDMEAAVRVVDPTPQQVADAMADLNAQAAAINAANVAAAEAFQATEPIVEPEA